jgi:hypothetical protein
MAGADRLENLYAHRHDLSHKLIKCIVDPDFEPDVEPLAPTLAILKSIRRFWTSIEKDTSSSTEIFFQASHASLTLVVGLDHGQTRQPHRTRCARDRVRSPRPRRDCHTALAQGAGGLQPQTFSLRTRGSRSIPSLSRLQPTLSVN